jgi:hypothetical protein
MSRSSEEFIGRARELALLVEAYAGGRSALIPVYGRRRVGKSDLILRFSSGRPAVYHVGKQSAPGLMVREWRILARRCPASLPSPRSGVSA